MAAWRSLTSWSEYVPGRSANDFAVMPCRQWGTGTINFIIPDKIHELFVMSAEAVGPFIQMVKPGSTGTWQPMAIIFRELCSMAYEFSYIPFCCCARRCWTRDLEPLDGIPLSCRRCACSGHPVKNTSTISPAHRLYRCLLIFAARRSCTGIFQDIPASRYFLSLIVTMFEWPIVTWSSHMA